MAINSDIEWTSSTWNPVTGCSKISQGCRHCYAEKMAFRLQAMGQPNYRNGFDVTLQEDMLNKPLSWKKPQMIFVNSMSDLFHKDVPLDFVQKVFDVMRKASWHIFQILSKRSERLLELNSILEWPQNVWVGVTVESNQTKNRIDHLRKTQAQTKFLSIEPLLTPIPNLNLRGIDWVIVGGESGFGARPMKEEWVIDIRNQCLEQDIPSFSSSGEVFGKRKTAGSSKAGHGMKCRKGSILKK